MPRGFEVSGIVVDPDGLSVAGAEVKRVITKLGAWNIIHSDEEGHSHSHRSPEEFKFAVEAPGFRKRSKRAHDLCAGNGCARRFAAARTSWQWPVAWSGRG
jgi:hypothetical protein